MEKSSLFLRDKRHEAVCACVRPTKCRLIFLVFSLRNFSQSHGKEEQWAGYSSRYTHMQTVMHTKYNLCGFIVKQGQARILQKRPVKTE